MSEADPKAMQSGGAIKRTQDDFRNLNKELKNPLLGNLPAVKAAASPVAQTASNAAVEEAPADLAPCRHPNNPICYFDMLIGDQPAGRIYFELHSHIVPKTCENFRQLCIGAVSRLNPGMKLHYKGSFMHRVVPGFMAQGGDFVSNDGSGGESIYGARFADESFRTRHAKEGLLSMANRGPNTNGSQFFLTTAPAAHLDGRHVCFGEVIWGSAVLKKIDECGTPEGKPLQPIQIKHCGVLKRSGVTSDSGPDGVDDCGGGAKKPATKRAKVDVKEALTKLTKIIQDPKRMKKACELVARLLESDLRSDNNEAFFALFTAAMKNESVAMSEPSRTYLDRLFREVQQRREFFSADMLKKIDNWCLKLLNKAQFR